MKFVLILLATMDALSGAAVATTAVFDDEGACLSALVAAKRLNRRFEGVCVKQSSTEPARSPQ
jgi:hypothetical protein